MQKNKVFGMVFVLFLAAAGVIWWRQQPRPDVRGRFVGPVTAVDGYARAERVIPFSFPADFGPHPDFQTEWWYYTGNLSTNQGERFGFQLTFFRRALTPPTMRAPGRASSWATDQIYLAHFALTDVEGGEFYAAERFSRGAAGLAGAQPAPYRVWLEDWFVEETGQNLAGRPQYHLFARQDGITLDLDLTDAKGPILQGEQGYSQKGPEPGNASYYISQTRLRASGTVMVGGRTFQVAGLSWKDHEFSTSALAEGQIGWDWFSIQLDNQTELMLFYLRREDGSIDPFSSGTLIRAPTYSRRGSWPGLALAISPACRASPR